VVKNLNLTFLTVKVLNFGVTRRQRQCLLTKKSCFVSLKVQAHVCTFFFLQHGLKDFSV
jgi:hypothetical protein